MSQSTFRAELMYRDINLCMHSECPHAKTCLRYLAFAYAQPFYARRFLDPRVAPQSPCEHYVSSQIISMAYGFRRGVNQVRHGDVYALKQRLRARLGWGRTHYYDFANGRKRITPEDQNEIRAVFAEFGVTGTELFDRVEESYLLPY